MKQAKQHARHYFLMTTRAKYAEFGDVSMVENFEGELPHPKDIVLVLKSHMSSDDISQAPFVFLPRSALQKLTGFPEYTVPRKSMATQTKKDLNKTIEKITQPPWCMNDAAQYLKKLIQQEGTVPEKPDVEKHPLEELLLNLKDPSHADGHLPKNLLKVRLLTKMVCICVSFKLKGSKC